ncbi:MAG: type II secretion system F family protein [Actinomycetota bacterium]|nr:type II secretion system F family protein [Actinomycetota bacterium]
MSGTPDALRALVTLLRAGLTLRQALVAWPDEVAESSALQLRDIAARIRLGHPLRDSIAGTALEPVLRLGFELHVTAGLDLAAWLDRTADHIEQRDDAAAAARAAGSGALLSGRMVAGLPLLFVPLAPLARAPLTDAAGLTTAAVGVALAVGGLRWIGRLVPAPPEEDPVAGFCSAVAALLGGGVGLSQALDLVASTTSGRLAAALSDARSLVRLGASWRSALTAVDPALASAANALERAQRCGTDLAGCLEAVASARRMQARRDFEKRMKKAPVMMVVPLTCCILPAYGLLGVVPFLRSMSLG